MGYHSITIIIVGYCHVLYIYKYICEIKILIYLKNIYRGKITFMDGLPLSPHMYTYIYINIYMLG
jgi:hypothetical protein